MLLEPGEARPHREAGLTIEGDLGVLDTLASVTDSFDPTFNIVTP